MDINVGIGTVIIVFLVVVIINILLDKAGKDDDKPDDGYML